MYPLLTESVIMGLLLIIFVHISSRIVSMFNLKPSLPEICATWNEKYVMEITLFLAGFVLHMLYKTYLHGLMVGYQ